MKWYWLSFARDEFLGACIVRGETLEEAVQSSWEHDCNPGNCSVRGFGPLDIEKLGVTPAGVDRFLTPAQVNRLGIPLRHTDNEGTAA